MTPHPIRRVQRFLRVTFIYLRYRYVSYRFYKIEKKKSTLVKKADYYENLQEKLLIEMLND